MTERPRILALFGGAAHLGQERGNIEALAALKEQGCDILCLIRDETWSIFIPSALDARALRWVKVPYIEHRLPGRIRYIVFRNPIAFVRANWRFLKIVRAFKPTHYHAFNQLYVLNFLIGLMLSRKPMIFRAGDEPTLHNWIWRATWRFVMSRVDRYVANSRFVARSLCESGVAPDRVEVIYNAPPRRTGPTETLPELPGAEDACRVVYIGQISEHKGVRVLIEAFRKLIGTHPHAQLVIAGRISEWSGDAWARQLRDDTVNDATLGPHVAFVGEISDVPGLLSRSTVHVAPSLFNDPSPNVVMEAKRSGCPSIVFPRGGMPELVQDGVDGAVCREATVASLAESLGVYLGNPGFARSQGQAALDSLNRLGIGQFSERWLETYMGVRAHRRKHGISPRKNTDAS